MEDGTEINTDNQDNNQEIFLMKKNKLQMYLQKCYRNILFYIVDFTLQNQHLLGVTTRGQC